MFDIKFDFDSRKLQRDLEKQVNDAAEKEVKRKLSDLMRKGLKVGKARSGSISLEGPDELIEDARKRLS